LYSADFYPKSPQVSIKFLLDSLLNSLTSIESFKNDALINNLIPTETVTAVSTETNNNVADKNPIIVKQMESLMKEAYFQNKDWPFFPGEENNLKTK